MRAFELPAVDYFPHGKLADNLTLRVTSRMNDGGVIFAGGIEQDFIAFDWGRRVQIMAATRYLHLVTG